MSRGLTRRVRELVVAGAVAHEVIATADHEADLHGHPYIGVEHLKPGRLAIDGQFEDSDALRKAVVPRPPKDGVTPARTRLPVTQARTAG